jgi:hypothetical protein
LTVWYVAGLVDSVNHVLELLRLSTNGKTRAFEVISSLNSDWFVCSCLL